MQSKEGRVMKTQILTFFLLLANLNCYSQHCGTIVTEEQVEYIRSFEKADTRNMSIAQGIIDVAIQFHIIRESDGSSSLDLKVLEEKVESLNEIYINANLRFISNSEYNFIDDSKYYNFDYYDEEELCSKHDMENVLNIYCVKSIRSGFYGYTYHPKKSQKQRMLMSELGWKNKSTFPHEMGHFFGLYHTHGKGGKIKEPSEPIERNIDRDGNGIIDCNETGDDLCDTPSDPNIGLKQYRQYCTQSCTLSEKIPGVEGSFYEPQITNIMSYNCHSDCRTIFTMQQLKRIYHTARKERKEIHIKKSPKTKTISAEVFFQMENKKKMPVDLDINLYRFKNKYKDGDSFSFEVNNLTKGNIYLGILNMDVRNKVVKVYPYKDDLLTLKPAAKINPLNGLITLDNGKQDGLEYTCLLFSFEPLNIDAIVSQMSLLEGTFTQKLYRVLRKQLLPLDHVNYMKGEKISFEGEIQEGQILPIMLEMTQDN